MHEPTIPFSALRILALYPPAMTLLVKLIEHGKTEEGMSRYDIEQLGLNRRTVEKSIRQCVVAGVVVERPRPVVKGASHRMLYFLSPDLCIPYTKSDNQPEPADSKELSDFVHPIHKAPDCAPDTQNLRAPDTQNGNGTGDATRALKDSPSGSSKPLSPEEQTTPVPEGAEPAAVAAPPPKRASAAKASSDPASLSDVELGIYWLIVAQRWQLDSVPDTQNAKAVATARWLVAERGATVEKAHEFITAWWHDPDMPGCKFRSRPWPVQFRTSWDAVFLPKPEQSEALEVAPNGHQRPRPTDAASRRANRAREGRAVIAALEEGEDWEDPAENVVRLPAARARG